MKKLNVGDWIHTSLYEVAVFLKEENDSIHIRYSATRLVDNKSIWCYNIVPKDDVFFDSVADDVSMKIAELKDSDVYGFDLVKI